MIISKPTKKICRVFDTCIYPLSHVNFTSMVEKIYYTSEIYIHFFTWR